MAAAEPTEERTLIRVGKDNNTGCWPALSLKTLPSQTYLEYATTKQNSTFVLGIALLQMAVTRKPYPRATLKKILKAHTNKSVSRNADALVGTVQASVHLF